MQQIVFWKISKELQHFLEHSNGQRAAMVVIVDEKILQGDFGDQGPLLLTWFNFNHSVDK